MSEKIDEFNRLGVICRICLKGDGPMSSIFAKNDPGNRNEAILATKITSIAQVELSLDDGLPASICESCHSQVNRFNEFRLLIESSDRALRSYLDDSQEKQKICEQSEGVRDLDCQTFLMESEVAEDSRELFGVNTILVPSPNGTEVWRICSVEGDEYDDQGESTAVGSRENVCNLKDIPRKVTLIQNTAGKQPLFFTTTMNSEESDRATSESEQMTCVTIMNEEKDAEEEKSLLPLNKYSCQLCLKPFKSLRTLKSHVKDHFLGGKEKIQICEKDKKNVRLSRKLKNSNRKSSGQGTKNCLQENGKKNPVACQSCEQIFESQEKLFSARIQTRQMGLDEKSMETDKGSCRDCGSEIPNSLNLDQAVLEDSSLTCTICNKHFRNAQSFKMHLRRHTLGSRFNCVECNKSYYSNSELARHMQLHTGMREYPCHLCEMSFFSKPELNRHTKYHNGEKKFQCKICFKSYYESGHLKVHERVHTGEKPFPCSICNKAFITRSKLIRHFKIHEKDSTS